MLYTKLFEYLRTNGGFSYCLRSGKFISTGFAVSPYPENEIIIPADILTQDHLERYLILYAELLAKRYHVFGSWLSDNLVYLDTSIIVQNLARALSIGEEHRQLAVYDLTTGKDILIPEKVLA